MALEGNLSSFGLSEILQLISVQQKTGMLTVQADDRSGVMFFRDGKLVSTRDRRRRVRDPFRDYLTRYGVVSRDDLIRISQISSQSKLDLTEILASERFMTGDEIDKHWRKQVQESVHDVLTWEQCSYKFISNEDIVAGIRTLGEFSVEAMLMESMRRIDEFPQMLAMFPTDQMLVTRVVKGVDAEKEKAEGEGEGEGKDEGDGGDGDDRELSQNETAILALLTDIVSIRDLVARGKMPLFEVYEALKLLKEKDLIKVKDEHSTGAGTTTAAGRSARGRALGNPLPFVAAALLFCAAGAVGMGDVVRRVVTEGVDAAAIARDDALERSRLEHALRWRIEAYRARHGFFPPSLDALVTEGLASDAMLSRAEEMSLRYRLTPGRPTYTLL
ncbi:MAG: DUF4388 domain-containing protein [Candidatus Krumholzibacteria bacterium]|nr:DUF4388 domain-containing protein [Candidatus Krumholzibacteria bacterium]